MNTAGAILGAKPRVAGRILLVCLIGASAAATPFVMTHIRAEMSTTSSTSSDPKMSSGGYGGGLSRPALYTQFPHCGQQHASSITVQAL
jgi:hypothetical protein